MAGDAVTTDDDAVESPETTTACRSHGSGRRVVHPAENSGGDSMPLRLEHSLSEATTMATRTLGKPGTSSPTSAVANKVRVFLVDDHPIVLRGLVQLINGETDLTVCGQGEDTFGALR